MSNEYGVSISCGNCGKRAEVDQWIRTATGPLPLGQFQCPHCRYSFRRQRKANHKPWEKFIELVPVQGRL